MADEPVPAAGSPVILLQTQCCIAGGGPAGIMLGLLLARAGVRVLVLEKHADFFRDFRGDTIHPSTLEVMHDLGFLDDLLKLPHHKAPQLIGWVGNLRVTLADFRHLRVKCPYIVFMPQWDFLNFLSTQARRWPGFDLRMQAQATELIESDGRILGLRGTSPQGDFEVRAALTIACDGRHSTLVPAAGLKPRELGAPMDVLWFKLTKRDEDNLETFGRFDAGRIFILIHRGDHYQCGYVIAKNQFNAVRARGLDVLRADIARLSGLDAARVETDVKSFEDFSLLTVAVNRLDKWWKPGFLAIGDAAHAMSPVGGVGINLALQDAIAAANLLAAGLRENCSADADLAAVQARRMWPTRVTQWVQVFVQNRIIAPALASGGLLEPPLIVRLLARFPVLSRLPARLIGIGVRPERPQL